MQVIGTEAQGDPDILREISEKARVAQSSSGISSFTIASPVTSGVESSDASPLPSRSSFAAGFVEGTDATSEPEEKLANEALTGPLPEASTTPAPEPTSAAAAMPDCAPGAGPYCVYIVKDGDTLSGIAEALGLGGTAAFSAAELIALSNGLNDAQNWLIAVGQELWIPLDSGVIHTVDVDQSVSVLAGLYGVASADIVAANGLADANSVVVGATLLIPSPNLWPLSGPAAAVVEGDAAEEEAAEEEATQETEEATETPETEATEDAPQPDAAAAPSEAESRPEDTAEAEATAEPEPARAASSGNANPSVAEIKDLFAEGYIAAGGPPQYLEHMLASVISCESGYNLRAFNPAGPFYGLMQFLPQTWANTGGGDWFDAWQQGHNTGVLLQSSTPQSQWPACWR